MAVVAFFASYIVFLLGWGLLLNLPLIAVLAFLRRKLPPRVPRVLLALGWAAGTFYALYRVEWFDVWRHGVPPFGFMLKSYGPYVLLAGLVGWATGSLLTPAAPPLHRRAAS